MYSFPHALGSPGIGTTAWHHVVGLARAGADVLVVCTSVARPLPPDVSVRVRQTLGPVRHRMVGVDRAYRWHDALTALVVRRWRPDVVHCWPRGVLRTAAAARAVGAVSVREAPSPYTPVALRQARTAWAQIGLEPPSTHFHAMSSTVVALEDREFRAVDVVVVGSQVAADTFTEAPFDVDVRVNGYGYDPQTYSVHDRPDDGALRVAFVGRLEPAKGLHTLLEAWGRQDRSHGETLHLCGALDETVRARLHEQLSDPTVVLRGHVSDVAGALAQADVLALPSFSEGNALVVYEAMGSAVVPLVSRAAGAPVTDGVDGLVHETGDVDQLSLHLSTVLTDAAERARLRRNAVDAATDLTWDRAGARLMNLYASLEPASH